VVAVKTGDVWYNQLLKKDWKKEPVQVTPIDAPQIVDYYYPHH
jgi:hypothetical protein